MTLILFKDFLIFIILLFSYMYVCATCVCLVPTETRRWHTPGAEAIESCALPYHMASRNQTYSQRTASSVINTFNIFEFLSSLGKIALLLI